MGGKHILIDLRFDLSTDVPDEKFESELAGLGLRTDRDAGGAYISELTQATWLGYLLCKRHLNDAAADIELSEPGRVQNTPVSTSNKTPSAVAAITSPGLPEKPDISTSNTVSSLESEPVKRQFSKRLYPRKSDALSRAQMVCREKTLPMWIHPSADEDGWHISSHGFSVSRRPDVIVNPGALDKRQRDLGFAPADYARILQPSVVARIAIAGNNFTQNGFFFSETIIHEWLKYQDDPALVLSIEAHDNNERVSRINQIQENIREELGYCSYYRWITADTAVLSVAQHTSDFSSAKERVQNPHWIIKAMSWPNSYLMKEKKLT